MPKHQSSESRIRALTEQFVAELTTIVRETALETVQDALGGSSSRRPGSTRKGPRRKSVSKTRRGTGKPGRRSSADVDAFATEVLSYVKSHPGSSATDLCSALGCATKDLRLPILKLLGEKKLRTEGQRRGTKYFAGSGGRKRKTTKKKARRKKTASKSA